MTLILARQYLQACTMGKLSLNGQPFCDTLELPWMNNQHGVSCIPEGEYKVVIDYSNRFQKWLPHVLNVPDRDGIRIHTGNTVKDTEGCILVGTASFDSLIGGSSRPAFKRLFELLKAAKEATLKIEKEA